MASERSPLAEEGHDTQLAGETVPPAIYNSLSILYAINEVAGG